jgi:hypothetical protein
VNAIRRLGRSCDPEEFVVNIPSFDRDILEKGRVVGLPFPHGVNELEKAGRWRTAKVPQYSTEPVNAYAIDKRMKQLGRSEQYAKELSRIATAQKIPADWGKLDQRCLAALKALGR